MPPIEEIHGLDTPPVPKVVEVNSLMKFNDNDNPHNMHPATSSMPWFSLEEERVMQQSSVSISLRFENHGINPVGDNAQVT